MKKNTTIVVTLLALIIVFLSVYILATYSSSNSKWVSYQIASKNGNDLLIKYPADVFDEGIMDLTMLNSQTNIILYGHKGNLTLKVVPYFLLTTDQGFKKITIGGKTWEERTSAIGGQNSDEQYFFEIVPSKYFVIVGFDSVESHDQPWVSKDTDLQQEILKTFTVLEPK